MTERADFLVNSRSPRYLHGFQKDTNETTELPHTVPADNQVTYIDSFTNYGVDTVYGKEYVIAAGSSPTVHNSLPGRSDADTHPASSITNTPAGNIAATTVQAAINELDSEKAQLAGTLTNQRVPFANASGFLTDNANFYYETGTGLRITDSTLATSTTTGALVVTGGVGIGGALYVAGQTVVFGLLRALPPISTATSGSIISSRSDIRLAPSGSSSAICYGHHIFGGVETGNAQNLTSNLAINANFIEISHAGTGTVQGMNGVVIFSDNSAAGTITSMNCIRVTPRNLSSGTITNSAGIRVSSLSNTSGTVTTNYGILVESQTSGTTNYSIFTNGGLVRLGGRTSIVDATASSSTTTGALVVTGGVGCGDYFTGKYRSSDGTAGLTATRTFYAASSSGGATNVRNTVTIKDGIITSWTQA